MKKRIVTLPPIVPTEYEEQAKLCDYLTYKGLLYFAIPNGEKRHLGTAMKLKRTGVKAGVPDIFIPMPNNGYHGLFIELKRCKGGTVSLTQRQWIEALKVQGYCAKVCKGAEDAIKLVNDYFYKAKDNAQI